MLFNEFNDPKNLKELVSIIKNYNGKKIKIMEICGTHTMAIAKSGIRSLLPDNIELISGPGCPVCVTPMIRIDEILKLAERKDVIIATYGDMIKVPGSKPKNNLERLKAEGASVLTVYSPLDAIDIAKNNPLKNVVFIGVGFETTTPGTALTIMEAEREKVKNFSVFSIHKVVEPAVRALIAMDEFDIDAFLLPGHVAVITGEEGFEYIKRDYNIPSVICGFETGDILASIYRIILQINKNTPSLINEYKRAVSYKGNVLAKSYIDKYFRHGDDLWRGLGIIRKSGLFIRDEYSDFDAVKRFNIDLSMEDKKTACSCGDVIKGVLKPTSCPLFGKTCTPENPIGPCMVSSEGSCAAYYKYLSI